MTLDVNDPRNIWVAPDTGGGASAEDGIGTFESPFVSITDALKKATAGKRVILMPGVYGGDLTIEISGDEKNPIYITSYETGEAVIENGCWYFYDACDLVVSGLTFRDAKRGAVSVVGQCLRNCFHSLNFIDCGTGNADSCTFYFGGSGGRFNIVEGCAFLRGIDSNVNDGGNKRTAAALMISDGGDGDFLMNHVIRQNRFRGYDTAVIAGSGNSSGDFESGHIIERNVIEDCRADGITVKCKDVQIRGNRVRNCASAGINLTGGGNSVIEGNGIAACGTGISASGNGHTATGNKIINCKSSAISANGNAESFFIYENTFVNCEPAPNDGFVAGDNISTRETDDETDDDNIGDDTGDGDSYIEAATPDDDADDTDDTDNDKPVINDEQEAILNFMFIEAPIKYRASSSEDCTGT